MKSIHIVTKLRLQFYFHSTLTFITGMKYFREHKISAGIALITILLMMSCNSKQPDERKDNTIRTCYIPMITEEKDEFNNLSIMTDTVYDTTRQQDPLFENISCYMVTPEVVEDTFQVLEFADTTVPINKDTSKELMPTCYVIVDQMPHYPGGEEAMYKFLSENVKYPVMNPEISWSGKVMVSFVVDIDGSLKDIKILKGECLPCADEVVRVIKLMPKWIPGKTMGKTVRTQFMLPVIFEPGE